MERPGFGPDFGAAQEDEGKTAYMPGIDVAKLRFPTADYKLQLLDGTGQWRTWFEISANGRNVGRSQNSSNFPFLSSMAVRHLRLSYDGPRLKVEDLGSLNGTYLKIPGPVELEDGTRFRVGSQVLEFHRAESFQPAQSIRSEDGEEFLSFDLEPHAYLDLIRPDNTPGLRFPITKEVTKIGRDGRQADIALPKAEWISGQHAQVRHDVTQGRFFLDDLNSRNGTFLQVRGSAHLNPGDILLVGRVFLRVVDSSVPS